MTYNQEKQNPWSSATFPHTEKQHHGLVGDELKAAEVDRASFFRHIDQCEADCRSDLYAVRCQHRCTAQWYQKRGMEVPDHLTFFHDDKPSGRMINTTVIGANLNVPYATG